MNVPCGKDPRSYMYLRLKAKKLIGHIRQDDPKFRKQNLRAAAELLEALLRRMEYLSVAEWIGSSMLASEQVRRSGLRGWFRAWRMRSKIVKEDLRRIGFGERT